MADYDVRPALSRPALSFFYERKTRLRRFAQAGGSCWRLNQSAAVKVVLVPLIGRLVFLAKFLKPSNEPRAGLFHSCSHGDLLKLNRKRTILQGCYRDVTSVTYRSFDRLALIFVCVALNPALSGAIFAVAITAHRLACGPEPGVGGVIRPGATEHAGEGRPAVATVLEGHGFIEAQSR
jgi:hypothetical protein